MRIFSQIPYCFYLVSYLSILLLISYCYTERRKKTSEFGPSHDEKLLTISTFHSLDEIRQLKLLTNPEANLPKILFPLLLPKRVSRQEVVSANITSVRTPRKFGSNLPRLFIVPGLSDISNFES